MPIKISGKKSSSNYLIILAGGPSGDGLIYQDAFPLFKKELEDDYQVVYYDQRGAGNCQGQYDTTTLNLQQLAEDLEKIVLSIHDQNRKAKIFLLGYSYGAAIGATFLQDLNKAQMVNGFISIAGAFDRVKQMKYQEQLIESWLQAWVKEGFISDYEALKTGFKCSDLKNPIACRRDSTELVEKTKARFDEVEKYNSFGVDAAKAGRLLGYVFFSQSNPINSGLAEGQNGIYFQKEFDQLLLSPKADKIVTPSLFLHGRYDTNAPYMDALLMYDLLGTIDGEREFVFLEKSGHMAFFTEPEKLKKNISDFIRKFSK